MPHRNSSRRATRLVLFTLADWTLRALGRGETDKSGASPDPWALDVELDEVTGKARRSKPKFSKRRLATTLAFTTLFFSGAAISAGAGDLVVGAVEDEPAAAETTTEETPEAVTTEEAAPEQPPAEPDPAPAPEPAAEEEPASESDAPAAESPPAEETPAEEAPADEPADSEQPADDSPAEEPADDEPVDEPDSTPPTGADPGDSDSSDSDDSDEAAGVAPVTHDTAPADVDFENAAFATLWLHRDLGDPTPPSRRLKRSFARDLREVSARRNVDWALVLGVFRARGEWGRVPATRRELSAVASGLAAQHAREDDWRAVLAYSGRTAFADKATAFARYNRAMGLRALVRGLEDQKPSFERRVLKDDRITLYEAGRFDVEHHRIDVRVLALLLYLAESHDQVTVSSLDTGHGLYSRPGVVSAHKYGLAVDISALEDETIVGHQQPGSVTERAVRNILLLPAELRPKQVISLLGLGGPSFPLANHDDHIHVGY